MVYTYDFEGGSAIGIEDYCEYVDQNVDVRDSESIAASAEQLYRLSLTRDLLNPIITSLKDSIYGQVQVDNGYTDATFILAKSANKKFFVRANAWKVPRLRGGTLKHEKSLYSYDVAHDHNFDFLTVGYCGPGYKTQIYEYDYNRVEGYVGEQVELRFLEDAELTAGRVMFYRRSRDIHTQKAPTAISVSLNLMTFNPSRDLEQQYYFDIPSSTIAGYVGGGIEDRVCLLEMAQMLGQEAMDPLVDIARKHACGRSRAMALRSMLVIAPGDRERLQTLFGNDPDPLVRREFSNAR